MADSGAGRIVGVLTAPGKTFRAIAERPTWGLAFAVLLIASVLSTAVVLQKVDSDAFRQQMSVKMESRGATPSDTQLDMMVKLIPVFAAGGLVVGVGFWFAVAGLLLVASNLVGGAINYRTSLAVTLHAMMPLALSGLLQIPVALGRASIDLQEFQRTGNLLPSSLASLASADLGQPLLALLSSADLFTFWTVGLLICGFHLGARVSKGVAATVVLTLWMVAILVKMGFAILGGGA